MSELQLPVSPILRPTTRRPPSWEPVEAGAPIGVPCEGGYVTERAPERGVRFKSGPDSIFIPESMIDEVMAHMVRT